MKKIIITLLAAMALLPATGRQAADFFVGAPQSIFPLIDRNSRLDMVDYANAGMSTPSKTRLDNDCSITEMSAERMVIKTSAASSTQLFIVPAANDTIIGVIKTVATPAFDSSVTLYDRNWQNITGRTFTAPALKDWLTDTSALGEVEAVVPFMLTAYDYDPATQTLTLTNSLEKFLSSDIYGMVSPVMRPALLYRWNGSRFKPAG